MKSPRTTYKTWSSNWSGVHLKTLLKKKHSVLDNDQVVLIKLFQMNRLRKITYLK